MTRLHYHIKWFPSGKLGWQSFDTLREAEERAKDLVHPDEAYVIEPIFSDCDVCAALTPRSANPSAPKKNAANG